MAISLKATWSSAYRWRRSQFFQYPVASPSLFCVFLISLLVLVSFSFLYSYTARRQGDSRVDWRTGTALCPSPAYLP